MSKRNRDKRVQSQETHEPSVPHNWPHGHVDVQFTGDNHDECLCVTVHGVRHYLHATTARELEKMLHVACEQHNEHIRGTGLPPV